MTNLYTPVLAQDIVTFEDEIIHLLRESISYLDSHENFYQGFLTGVLRGIKGYRAVSNRESGSGCSEIFLKPTSIRKLAVIIEVKIANKPQDLEKLFDEVLAQIEEKQYDEELQRDGYTNRIKYRKNCMIKLCEQSNMSSLS